MRNLFHHQQIVQRYPPMEEEESGLAVLNLTPRRHFFEEQMFEELERTAIVEDYLPGQHYPLLENNRMEEEENRAEEEPYEELSLNQFAFASKKILDSASSGR